MDVLINIDVDDLAGAERFYCAAFGLSPGRRFGELGVELLGAAAPIYLLAKPAGSAATEAARDTRRYDRHWTPVHLDFVVDDIEAATWKAVAEGAVLEAPISAHEWGKLARLADPFGHGLCLVEFSEEGYDAIASSRP
ncbi:MAG TPA: VOC family protein [Gammaproteobacteria bacterium]